MGSGVTSQMDGGTRSLRDIEPLIGRCGIIEPAAGSLFVVKGVYRAVVITYSYRAETMAICAGAFSGECA